MKAKIVEEDPEERGKRSILNLGHTFAHAIEAYSQKQAKQEDDFILHGEAVGLGLAFVANLSREMGYLSANDQGLIIDSLKQSNILLSRERFEKYLGPGSLNSKQFFKQIIDFILMDKKVTLSKSGYTDWVLLKGLGKFCKDSDESYTLKVSNEIVLKSFENLSNSL